MVLNCAVVLRAISHFPLTGVDIVFDSHTDHRGYNRAVLDTGSHVPVALESAPKADEQAKPARSWQQGRGPWGGREIRAGVQRHDSGLEKGLAFAGPSGYRRAGNGCVVLFGRCCGRRQLRFSLNDESFGGSRPGRRYEGCESSFRDERWRDGVRRS